VWMRESIRPEHLVIGRADRVPVKEAAHARIRTTDLLSAPVDTVGKR
jgi:hypothetical protein